MTENLTKEELELFKTLKEKVKKAKESSKEAVNKVFNKVMENLDVEEVFDTITISGGNSIRTTVKLEDGRKFSISITDKGISNDTDGEND